MPVWSQLAGRAAEAVARTRALLQHAVVMAAGDLALSGLVALGSGILVLWCVPSTFMPKGAYVRYMTTSTGVRRFTSVLPWLFLWLCYRVWRPSPAAAPAAATPSERFLLETQARRHKTAIAACLTLFMYRLYYLAHNNAEAMISLDYTAVERDMLRFRPPPLRTLELVTAPYAIFDPVFLGLDNIPTERPLLFVSNHTVMGLEFPLLLTELYKRKGIFLRALADHSHFQVPGNATVLRDIIGAVDGNHRNADLLMEHRQCVLVYPGGARETFKRVADRKYQLFWKKQAGFAKLAIRHGCTIVPIVNVGTEDMLDVVYDLPIGWLPIPFLWGGDRKVPVLKPVRLQRLYFVIGEPISTDSYGGDFYSEENIEDVHNKTERAVLEGIEFLRQIQKDDTKRERMPLRVLDMLRSLSEKSRAPGVKPREVGVPRNARL